MADVDTYLNRCYDILLHAHDDINGIPEDELCACEFMVKHYEETQPEFVEQEDKAQEQTGT